MTNDPSGSPAARGAVVPLAAWSRPTIAAIMAGAMADTHADSLWAATHSSLLRRASDAPPGMDRDAAWRELIDTYRRPITVCLLKRVQRHPDAEAIITEFFSYLFTEGVIAKLDSAKGRFRVFLQGVMDNYVKGKFREYRPRHGDAGLNQVVDVETPPDIEAQEERAWARSLFDRAADQLLRAMRRDGKILLKVYGIDPYRLTRRADIAARLGLSTNAVDQAVSRARNELNRRLEFLMAQMCDGREDLEAEKRALVGRLREAAPGLFEPGR